MLSHQEKRLLVTLLALLLLGLGGIAYSRIAASNEVNQWVNAATASPADGTVRRELNDRTQSTAKELQLAAIEDQDAARSHKESAIVVHVAGAVNAPGVYELPVEARVFQALEAAGGAAADAFLDALNLAEPVRDAMRIYVPSVDDGVCPEPVEGLTGAGHRAIDINRATAEELQQLPGIGPVLAGRIIAHRDRHGPFRSVEDLLAVTGIGPKLLEQLHPYVLVR